MHIFSGHFHMSQNTLKNIFQIALQRKLFFPFFILSNTSGLPASHSTAEEKEFAAFEGVVSTSTYSEMILTKTVSTVIYFWPLVQIYLKNFFQELCSSCEALFVPWSKERATTLHQRSFGSFGHEILHEESRLGSVQWGLLRVGELRIPFPVEGTGTSWGWAPLPCWPCSGRAGHAQDILALLTVGSPCSKGHGTSALVPWCQWFQTSTPGLELLCGCCQTPSPCLRIQINAAQALRDNNRCEFYRNKANTEASCFLFSGLLDFSVMAQKLMKKDEATFPRAVCPSLPLPGVCSRGKDPGCGQQHHGWCGTEQREDGHTFTMEALW